MNTISVVSRCCCQPENTEEFLTSLEVFLPASRNEQGCLSYDVYLNTQDPCSIVFHEVWRDQDAVNFHISSSHFAEFMANASSLLEKINDESLFIVTIASPFDPKSPPEGAEVIVATLCRTLPGKAEEVRDLAPEMILNPSSAEAGCLEYLLFQGMEHQDRFLLYEVWKGFSAIQEHMGTTHFAQFMGKAPDWFTPLDDGALFSVNICVPYL